MTSQEANSIPLGDILSHYGYEPSRRYGGYDMYRSPFRSDTSPSFKVFKQENRWYDFGDGTYGSFPCRPRYGNRRLRQEGLRQPPR